MANSITQFKKELENRASFLDDYDRNYRSAAQITKWTDKYCELRDRLAADPYDYEALEQSDIYISALMLKFWDQIKMLYDKTRTVGHNEYEDFTSILYERIEYACKYRAWQKPDSKLNAQQCINMALSTEVKNIYYFANLDKNKANSAALQTSFDQPMEGDEENQSLADITADEYATNYVADTGIQMTIQNCIDEGAYIEAIIYDTIAFGDCEKVTKETKTFVDENGEEYKTSIEHRDFWARKCIQYLSELPADYKSYFMNKYNITKVEAFDAVLERIRTSNNTRLYKYLEAAQNKLKTIYSV